MNLLNWVRDRLGLSPAAAGRSQYQAPRPTAPAYGFEAHSEGDEVHIRLEGEIDCLSAGEVEEKLLQAFHLAPGIVHLNLRDLNFMVSHGFFLMFRMAKRLRSEKRAVACVTSQRMATFFGMSPIATMLNVTVEE
jgi:anti-anti-sigma factor